MSTIDLGVTAIESVGAAASAAEPPLPRWKTLSNRDPEFSTYLDGSFSNTYRALPVRSLNVGTALEEVTFEIVPVSDIHRPSLFETAWRLIRPQSLALSVAPMLATWFFVIAAGRTLYATIALSSFIAVLCFHAAANLFNDYGDHVKGRDRQRPHGGSRVIQNGWVRAISVRRAAWALTVLGALGGLPAVALHLAPIALLSGVVGLATLEFAFQRLRLKYRGWAEIVAFAMTGPLLTGGFAWAATGSADLATLALGCVFGSISLMYFHSANFENIMVDSQAGVRTWATRAGFDASKRFFVFTAALTVTSISVFVGGFTRDTLLIPAVAAVAVAAVLISRRVAAIASPLSSDLNGLRFASVRLAWIAAGTLVAGFALIWARGAALG